MDNKFSSAIHTLILISESDKPLTSEDIAGSVGTNSSYIRKIIGLLKKRILSKAIVASADLLQICSAFTKKGTLTDKK